MKNLFTTKKINQKGLIKQFFKAYEVGVLGCGKYSLPWIDLSEYIVWPTNVNLILKEIKLALEKFDGSFAASSCLMPEKINGYNFMTYYEFNADKFIPTDILNTFTTIYDLNKWVNLNLSRPIWKTVLVAKKHPLPTYYWTQKHGPGNIWQNNDLKLTQTWIESQTQLFKSIGRVVIFENICNNSVTIHRDCAISENGHNSHFVNLQFVENRPVFVYDEITNEKIYIPSQAYMFNECDYHGVDFESKVNFTIRIDGTFHEHICNKLNFIDGKVFSKDYISGSKLEKLKIIDID
jgi:hypothetical protein